MIGHFCAQESKLLRIVFSDSLVKPHQSRGKGKLFDAFSCYWTYLSTLKIRFLLQLFKTWISFNYFWLCEEFLSKSPIFHLHWNLAGGSRTGLVTGWSHSDWTFERQAWYYYNSSPQTWSHTSKRKHFIISHQLLSSSLFPPFNGPIISITVKVFYSVI